jgi:hypothetical protein
MLSSNSIFFTIVGFVVKKQQDTRLQDANQEKISSLDRMFEKA